MKTITVTLTENELRTLRKGLWALQDNLADASQTDSIKTRTKEAFKLDDKISGHIDLFKD